MASGLDREWFAVFGLNESGPEMLPDDTPCRAEHHDEPQSHDAFWFLNKDGGCEKQRVFEKAEAALDPTLVFLGAEKSLLGKGCCFQHVGSHNPARFAKDFLHEPSGS